MNSEETAYGFQDDAYTSQNMEAINDRDQSDLSQEWSCSIFGLRWTYQENHDSYSNRR